MAGVTSTGFVPKTADEIRASIAAFLRSPQGISKNLTLTDDTILGAFITPFVSELALAWSTLEAAFNTFDISKTDEDGVVALAAALGVSRKQASAGVATVYLTLNRAVDFPAGSLVATPQVDFGEPIADNRWVNRDAIHAAAPGVFTATFVSEVIGSAAKAFDAPGADGLGLAAIAEPRAGWDYVAQATEVPGEDIETVDELKSRLLRQVAFGGQGTGASIVAKILAASNIRKGADARVAHNPLPLPADGMLPHEAVVQRRLVGLSSGDADKIIAAAVPLSVPYAIKSPRVYRPSIVVNTFPGLMEQRLLIRDAIGAANRFMRINRPLYLADIYRAIATVPGEGINTVTIEGGGSYTPPMENSSDAWIIQIDEIDGGHLVINSTVF